MDNKKIFIFLILILAIASFFRLWHLNSIPPGVYPDEAINGNDAIQALNTGQYKLFYPDNNGREGLFINLIALSFNIFGVHIWSLKLISALIGIFQFLACEFFQNCFPRNFGSFLSSLVVLFSVQSYKCDANTRIACQ